MAESATLSGGARVALTSELFVIPIGSGRYLIYAPLQASAVIGNSRVVEVLQRVSASPGSVESNDPAAVLLRSLGILDPESEQLPAVRFTGPPMPTEVTLLLTTACNLRCSYCYAATGEGKAEFMPLDTAARAIRFVVANAVQRDLPSIGVCFHGGGEPTVHWPVLTAASDYARRTASESGRAAVLTLATNGYLTDSQVEWIVKNLNNASLSFDGLPDIHDVNRPTASGFRTSRRVMDTMRALDRAGFRYGVRVTVLASQVHRLEESVDFIFTNFRPSLVQVEPVYQLGRGRSEEKAETEEFIEQFRRARGRWPALMFSGAKLRPLANHFCAATMDGFCISASGGVTACPETFTEGTALAGRFFYGRPAAGSDGYVFDSDRLEFLRGAGVENREFCQSCFARWTCAGDCLHKVLDVSDGGEPAGAGRCGIIRELTKDLILEQIAKAGGSWWRGRAGRAASVLPCLGECRE